MNEFEVLGKETAVATTVLNNVHSTTEELRLAYEQYQKAIGYAPFGGQQDGNVFWRFNETINILTLWGVEDGIMNNYSGPNAPWSSFKEQIHAVVVLDGVTSIGDYAFYGCSNLASIAIPESVMYIFYHAFEDCSSLTSITIPENVTCIGGAAFSGCSSLTSITIPERQTLIGDEVFCGCSSLVSINIPESVTRIGNNAFRGCNSLTSITLPEGLKSIDFRAFMDCSSLAFIILPEGLKSIGNDAFQGCCSLSFIVIPETMRNIGTVAFYGCSNLKVIVNNSRLEITKGSTSLGEIGYYADAIWTNAIKEGDFWVTYQDEDKMVIAFVGNSTEVKIPNDVSIIGSYAFQNRNGFTFITIPESVTNIGNYAFAGCSSLSSIVIPASMRNIGTAAFHGCSNLKVVINNSPLSITKGSTLNGEIGCYAYAIWKNAIKEGDFWTCYQGDDKVAAAYVGDSVEVKIPNDVSIIGSYAFQNRNSLTFITIPESVTSIGNYTFKGCSSIQQALLLPTAPPCIGSEAFPADLTIFVVSNGYESWNGYNICLVSQLVETDFLYTGTAPGLNFRFSDLFTMTYNSNNIEKDCGYHVLETTVTSSLLSDPLLLSVGYTILPCPLTVTACSVEREYGMDAEYEYECVGFVEGEDRSVFIKEPAITSNADKDSDVGEYAIVPSGAEAKNYSFEYVNGKLTIVPASQEIVWDQEFPSKVLIGSEYELTAVATSGLPVSYIVDDAYVSDLYEYDGKTYFGCNVLGTLSIRAVQEGDKNHKSARRVSKTFNVVKELTGVDEVASDTNITPIYDLSGRRVDASDAVRGIYIQNGKKVYRK